jgi:tRNA (mo5U34)-methyltransferase
VDARASFDVYGVPADLRGLKALEIGAWDGPYTFELERRGADVTALDIQDPDHTGFNTAKKILNSKAEYVRGRVEDIPEDWKDRFDLVLYMGVFYHLRDPMGAFDRLWAVMKDKGDLFYEGACLDYSDKLDPEWKRHRRWLKKVRDIPVALFVADSYMNDDTNWFIPTHKCVGDWLRSSGFEIVQAGVDQHASRSWGHARKVGDFKQVEHFVVP